MLLYLLSDHKFIAIYERQYVDNFEKTEDVVVLLSVRFEHSKSLFMW